VMRTSANEIRYARDQRWGEALVESVPRVLQADIGAALAPAGVEVVARGSRADSYLDVSLQRFETGADARAELRARWSVHERGRPGEPRRGGVRLVDDRGGPPAAGLSRLLARLAGAIAADVRPAAAANR